MFIDIPSLQHAYTDGRLEEVVLRHLGSDDGSTVIAKDIRFTNLSQLTVTWFKSSFFFYLFLNIFSY